MTTARGGIITRGRQQRSGVRGLLLRHPLLLRVASQSVISSWIDTLTLTASTAPKPVHRRFYSPLPQSLSSPVTPERLEFSATFNDFPTGKAPAVAAPEPAGPGAAFVAHEYLAETTPPDEEDVADSALPAEELPTRTRAEAVPVETVTPQRPLGLIKALTKESRGPLPETAIAIPDVPDFPEVAIVADNTDGPALFETVGPPPPVGRRRRGVEEITRPALTDKPPAEQTAAAREQTHETHYDADAHPAVGADDAVRPTAAPPVIINASTRTATPAAAASEPVTEAALFAPIPVAEDRTPASWLARLQGSLAAPKPVAAVARAAIPTHPPTVAGRFVPAAAAPVTSQPPSQTETVADGGSGAGTPPEPVLGVPRAWEARPVPAPVSLKARRVLRPLIGFDPADVPVYRGGAARQATEAFHADALALGGEAVVLGSAAEGAGEDAPETLGLLAHEMTHIARHRTPRFVPPIVVAEAKAAAVRAGFADSASSAFAAPGADEAVAQQAESLVRHHVTAISESAGPAVLPLPPSALSAASNEAPLLPAAPAAENWNGLPAPWEPLPAFMNVPLTSAPAALELFDSGHTEGALVQRAPADRSLAAPSEAAASPPASLSPPTPSPDLDVLARQVYDKLKRRLAAEQRQRLR